MSDHDKAVQRIDDARDKKANVLNLGDLQLDSLPEELGFLPDLRVLGLGKYEVRLDGEEVKSEEYPSRPTRSFTNLDVLRGLTGLQGLDLAECTSLRDVSGLQGL